MWCLKASEGLAHSPDKEKTILEQLDLLLVKNRSSGNYSLELMQVLQDLNKYYIMQYILFSKVYN